MSGMFDDVEGVVKRQMVLFFILDTSGSMNGTKIGAVNTAIREVLPELRGIGGSDFDLKIACLTFSKSCEWMYPSPQPVENFNWKGVSAGGPTPLGAACRELNKKLSKNEFMTSPSGSVAPVLFLMSDGAPTDEFEAGLSELEKNNWFKYAIKVAVAIGDDADQNCLAKFTGTEESVITVHTPDALKEWIKAISITSSQIGSQSSNTLTQSKQDTMITAIKEMPDLYAEISEVSSISTSADAW